MKKFYKIMNYSYLKKEIKKRQKRKIKPKF